jgi:hypothetical protein
MPPKQKRKPKQKQKRKTHVAKKPQPRKVKHMAKTPKVAQAETQDTEPKHPGTLVDATQTELDRLRSVLEQVDVDIEAGQIATAHARIKAALIHGHEPEPEPQESK